MENVSIGSLFEGSINISTKGTGYVKIKTKELTRVLITGGKS
jgi:hypothetical protein